MDWEAVFASRASRMKASEIREILKLLEQPDIISFAGGVPDANLFPKQEVADAYARVLSDERGTAALQYSISEGHKPLRQWLVGEMGKLRVPCTIDNILITSGSQQVLDYVGKMFLSPRDTALVMWPTYLGALGAFNAYEPTYDRLNPLSNREPESYVEAATKAGGKVKLAYCVPEFSNPTGETISRQARESILDLADALNIVVIEDAAYQMLRYDGEMPPPVLALDVARNGGDIEKTRTLYCGSFSKTLAPGLRLGWVAGASEAIRRLVLVKQAADLHTSTINQMVIGDVAPAVFESQVEKIRTTYGKRRDHMLDALGKHMPAGVEWTRPEGGMFLWLRLPEGIDGAALLSHSLKTERVAFVPGKSFHADGSGANTIRLSFSCATEDMIDRGIAALGRAIRSVPAQAG